MNNLAVLHQLQCSRPETYLEGLEPGGAVDLDVEGRGEGLFGRVRSR